MSGRGEKILGLATPQPQKLLPTMLTRKPLSFRERMDNTQTFLNSLRTPDDGHKEVVESEKVVDDVTTPVVDESEKENVPRRTVNFGPLGFINYGSNDDDYAVDGYTSDSNGNGVPDVEETLQVANEHTPVVEKQVVLNEDEDTLVIEKESPAGGNRNRKRKISDKENEPTVEKRKTKKRKTAKEAREALVKVAKDKAEEKERSDRAIKKSLKDNFLTLKVKLSLLHTKAGSCPDFALFVKDTVHDPDAPNPAAFAGKYLTYSKGDLCTKFFSKGGISYNPDDFFLCKNDVDLKEDKELAIKRFWK